MTKALLSEKMIRFYHGNHHDVEHFLKVHAYAALIGQLEALPDDLQKTLEMAAIVHDIACPLCRQKYGNAAGSLQEKESEALLRPVLSEFAIDAQRLERVIWLVCHHHTTDPVDGVDHRILLEADFLVNASEGQLPADTIRAFRDKVFRTAAGMRLLAEIYPEV